MEASFLEIVFDKFLRDVYESGLADTDSFGAALFAGVEWAFEARRDGFEEPVIFGALVDVIDRKWRLSGYKLAVEAEGFSGLDAIREAERRLDDSGYTPPSFMAE